MLYLGKRHSGLDNNATHLVELTDVHSSGSHNNKVCTHIDLNQDLKSIHVHPKEESELPEREPAPNLT
ncbi:uncharacterized protein RAG0_10720 [Rhynchosporium agropyri]|uniref:Uncharacterized protein n=1 Tax=Rhynchosporium agropyri TaxID=914238 RepID=A0A1E1L102_9HELO|nr:uncharacterized protein RAG0_10720 [Rhynchosporium agropyri]